MLKDCQQPNVNIISFTAKQWSDMNPTVLLTKLADDGLIHSADNDVITWLEM